MNLEHRLHSFYRTGERPCLLADASAGVALGPLPGLENFPHAAQRVLPLLDGLVCSPGQVNRLNPLPRQDGGLLVRMDWSNTLRGPDFILAPHSPRQVGLGTAEDALAIGADGMVSTLLLGYEAELEAASVRATVQLAMEGRRLGLPLVAEVRADGPRVALPGKAVELGASYALEGGAEMIVVPFPGEDSLKTLGEFVSVPWLVKPSSLERMADEWALALRYGAAGGWLDSALFAQPDPGEWIALARTGLGAAPARGG